MTVSIASATTTSADLTYLISNEIKPTLTVDHADRILKSVQQIFVNKDVYWSVSPANEPAVEMALDTADGAISIAQKHLSATTEDDSQYKLAHCRMEMAIYDLIMAALPNQQHFEAFCQKFAGLEKCIQGKSPVMIDPQYLEPNSIVTIANMFQDIMATCLRVVRAGRFNNLNRVWALSLSAMSTIIDQTAVIQCLRTLNAHANNFVDTSHVKTPIAREANAGLIDMSSMDSRIATSEENPQCLPTADETFVNVRMVLQLTIALSGSLHLLPAQTHAITDGDLKEIDQCFGTI